MERTAALWIVAYVTAGMAAATAAVPTICGTTPGDKIFAFATMTFVWPFVAVGRIGVWAVDPETAGRPLACAAQRASPSPNEKNS